MPRWGDIRQRLYNLQFLSLGPAENQAGLDRKWVGVLEDASKLHIHLGHNGFFACKWVDTSGNILWRTHLYEAPVSDFSELVQEFNWKITPKTRKSKRDTRKTEIVAEPMGKPADIWEREKNPPEKELSQYERSVAYFRKKGVWPHQLSKDQADKLERRFRRYDDKQQNPPKKAPKRSEKRGRQV